jgi:hypothetical protein
MNLVIKEMLLIEEPTVKILKDELMNVAGWFVLPSFVFALALEYFGDLKFLDVVKKLILVLAFIGCFYSVHSEGVNLSFKASEEILKKVSPNNIFLRKWTEVKVKTKDEANWSRFEKFAIPNINDLLATTFFLMSKLFIWILKLIYSTVYHLTYIFAPLSAVLYFFPITRSSIAGTIQSSLWCMFMPIVLVSILAIVGNSIQVPANHGEVSIVGIDHILWLFGVTLLLLMSPVLTIGILRGGGVAMSGSAIGVMMTGAGMKVLKLGSTVFQQRQKQSALAASKKTFSKGFEVGSRMRGNSYNNKKSINGNEAKISTPANSTSNYSNSEKVKAQIPNGLKISQLSKGAFTSGNNINRDIKSNTPSSSNEYRGKDTQTTRSEMKEAKPQLQSKIQSKEKSPEIFREQKRELKSVNSREMTKDLKQDQRLDKNSKTSFSRMPRKSLKEVRNEV